MKKYLFLIISLISIITLNAQNTGVIQSAYDQYHKTLPQEKLYLHTDRSFYKPGETLWFKAYLADAELKQNAKSQIVHVELLNPKGNVEKKLKLTPQNGILNGEFDFAQDAAGGIYKIKAYTQWMSNFEEGNYFFEKEITLQNVVLPNLLMTLDFEKEAYGVSDEVVAEIEIRTPDDLALSYKECVADISLGGKKINEVKVSTDKNGLAKIIFNLPSNLSTSDGLLNVKIPHEGSTESISRSIPIVMNNIAMEFFPEGGDLMYGTENKLAFKALDEFGKAADISGQLLDDSQNVMASFKSYHQGMGAFNFTPEKGKKYSVKISRPEGIKKSYPIPTILENGLGIRLLEKGENNILLSVYSPSNQKITATAYIRGNLERNFSFDVKKGDNKLSIPTENMPIGILQLTIFDQGGDPQAERLVFVNEHRKINAKITTDKNQYLPREEVEVSLEITDESGKGVEGHFSLAVIDDNLHTFADDKQDNILSYFLMSSDLKGEIEEPNFYFDPK